MISVKQIQDILSLYQKHGWQLRRILLTPKSKKHFGSSLDIFFGVEITEAPIDAVWFSRASGKDKEAWELRRLSETPYALVEVFESGTEESEGAEIRREMEAKLQGTFTV